MISRLKGILVTRDPGAVEIETAGGVVYDVEVPLTVFQRLPARGSAVELRTVQVVSEKSVVLYGFIDDVERTLFQRLLTASGVGGKLALALMSAYRADRLARAQREVRDGLLGPRDHWLLAGDRAQLRHDGVQRLRRLRPQNRPIRRAH